MNNLKDIAEFIKGISNFIFMVISFILIIAILTSNRFEERKELITSLLTINATLLVPVEKK